MKNLHKRFILFAFLLMANKHVQAATVAVTLNQQPCNNNGIITATVTGLTPPLTFYYQFYTNNNSISHTGITTNTDILNNYSGEQIYIQVTDGSNNYATTTFSALPFTIALNTTSGVCPVLATATATITGGSAPYTYQWKDNITNNIVSTSNPASLFNEWITLTATDNNGCTVSISDSINYSSNINFTTNTTTANCTNGTATVTNPTGGVAPYTYLWSNGTTTASVSNLLVGNYDVRVTDAQGCNNLQNVYIQQGITINTNVVATNATCLQNNGALIAFGSGGVSPYTYQWSNGQSTQNITNLSAGNYTLTATDANGCIGSGYGTVNASTPITVTQTNTPSSCTSATGSATILPTGGTAPYTTTWNTSPLQTGTTASSLGLGNYSFHVVDAVGCVQNGTVNIQHLNPIFASTNSSNTYCTQSTGNASVIASGGTPPFTYLWSNGNTNSSINNLAAGNYAVTITDNAMCKLHKGLYIGSYSPVNVATSTIPASCKFTSDGIANAYATGGTAPYTYHWSNGATTSVSSNLATGNYFVDVNDINGCYASYWPVNVGYNALNNSCYCTLNGKVFNDINGNCVQDAGELGIPNIQIHCSSIGYTYTDANGNYYFQVPTGTYTLSESVQSFYPLSTCQNNAITVNSTASAGCVITNNFANSINPLNDLHVDNWNWNYAIPGNIFTQKYILTNMGTVDENTVVASHADDGQLNGASVSPIIPFVNALPKWYNTYATTNYSIPTGASTASFINYNVPTNIPLNTQVLFKDSVAYNSSINNWLTDYSPWNNLQQSYTTIIGSYDPNNKQVLPQGVGPQGYIYEKDTALDYMVHFQNTGTYYAQNIVVLDTLDADLNWSTLRPMYKSHPCTVTINDAGVARFEFKNIHLSPVSNNDGMSEGAFSYTINRKSNLAVGTQIKNSAAIYFDYNKPVITNTTLNTIGSSLGISNTTKYNNIGLSIYPNPTEVELHAIIENTNMDSPLTLSICDITGKTLITKNAMHSVEKQDIVIDVHNLTTGIYFIKLQQKGEMQTCKFIKR